MYFYKIGYNTPEESLYREYAHGAKYTGKQLQEIVWECLAEILPTVMAEHEAMKAECEDKHFSLHDPWIESLFDERAFWLALEARGFEPVEYAAQFSAMGWGSCINDKDWKGWRDSATRALCRFLKKSLAS